MFAVVSRNPDSISDVPKPQCLGERNYAESTDLGTYPPIPYPPKISSELVSSEECILPSQAHLPPLIHRDVDATRMGAREMLSNWESTIGVSPPQSTLPAESTADHSLLLSPFKSNGKPADLLPFICAFASAKEYNCSMYTAAEADPAPLKSTSSEAVGTHISSSQSLRCSSPDVPATPKIEIKAGSDATKRARPSDPSWHSPAPKRMTLSSQRKQHLKLSSPFKSPLLTKSDAKNSSPTVCVSPESKELTAKVDGEDKDTIIILSRVKTKEATPETPETLRRPFRAVSVGSKFSSTARAASQFRSPLIPTSQPSTMTRSSPLGPIQILERKVQLLSRAIKIKKGGDEDVLEQLTKKWRLVGREAAWELWQIVRDNDESSDAFYPGTTARSTVPPSSSWGWANISGEPNGNWGWASPDKKNSENEGSDEDIERVAPSKLEAQLYQSLKRQPAVTRSSMLPPTPRGAYFMQRCSPDMDNNEISTDEAQGCGVEDPTTIEAAVKTRSLGTMLSQLSIAHETLGWIEEEGDFVDN